MLHNLCTLSVLASPQKKNASNKTIAFFAVVVVDFADFKDMSHHDQAIKTEKMPAQDFW